MNARDRKLAQQVVEEAEKLKERVRKESKNVANGGGTSGTAQVLSRMVKQHGRQIAKITGDATHHRGMDKVKDHRRAKRVKQTQDESNSRKRKSNKFSGVQTKRAKSVTTTTSMGQIKNKK